MTARIEVRLEGGERDGDLRFYRPGETVSGTAAVAVGGALDCRHLWVRLIWFSEGRADEDVGKVDERDIHQGELRPGEVIESAFGFALPAAPWSYAGTYVSIVWAVEVVIDVPLARDVRHRERFVLRPAAAR